MSKQKSDYLDLLGKKVVWWSGAKNQNSWKKGTVVYISDTPYTKGFVPPLREDLVGKLGGWSSVEEYTAYAGCPCSRKKFEAFATKRAIVRVERGLGKRGSGLVDHYYAPNPGLLKLAEGREGLREYYGSYQARRLEKESAPSPAAKAQDSPKEAQHAP